MTRTARVSEPALRADWLRSEIAVIGLARSGRAVATLLARSGNTVYASDGAESDALRATASQLTADGVAVQLGGHDLERIAGAGLLVASPGVPPDAPPLVAARRAGVDIVSEVEIGLRFLPNLRYIAVTGTNGKTTTTAMVAHLLEGLGHRAVAAGNIGTPLSELALRPAPPEWAALEVSSFQLHDTPGIRPVVGVLTNVSPNHLDRYASAEEYYADKQLLFRNATPESQWVVNRDDEVSRSLARGAAGVQCDFSTEAEADAWYDRPNDRLIGLGCPLIQRNELHLLGDHNVANALAAALSVMLADPAHRTPAACDRIAAGLRSFRSLEHRIEVVAEQGGVLWINDSKSTNIASTLVALRGMTRPTVLLLGGKHKGEPYTALVPELGRVKKVIAYGEAAPLITRDLDGAVTVEQGGTAFADVVARARAAASPGDAILLSPACSSYDMFANYEQRGLEFKRLVTGA
ncbi:MAG TPA: UDP-N-acetylmuramoyl-L-alanine--D-glutamate ligase [Gemmatimonadaceae bacterium]|nr:UDP-N-acetylmuramoyl-L-alanine--D-glutamate ligase [Gemmatimonadaceae bacterium]